VVDEHGGVVRGVSPADGVAASGAAGLWVLATGGVAGCSQSSSDPATAPATDSPTATATETPTASPTATPSPTPVQQPYRVDRQPANEANAEMRLFQFSTERLWDDLTVDLEPLDEWHENDFHRDRFNTDFPSRIKDGLEERKTDPVKGLYPNDDEEDTPLLGEFKFSEFQDADNFDTGFSWLAPLWYSYAQDELGGISSTQQYKMAPSVEKAFEKHTSLDIHAWGFNAPVITAGGNNGQNLIIDKSNENQVYLGETT
jgi:hypothetical protein